METESTVSVLTRVARIEPSTDTPIAPPKVRKNATILLAAPMFSTLTVFCTARTMFCISMPVPRPTMAMKIPIVHRLVAWSIVDSSPKPTSSRTAPATMKASTDRTW